MNISIQKKEKISEQILAFLYLSFPKPIFNSHIAKEIARDEEFIKGLLKELKSKGLLIEIKKNPKGKEYLKRTRWKLSDGAYEAYSQKQTT